MARAENRRSRAPAFEVIFIVCGIWLIGLGLYFAFLRPALLPEDLRYIGTTTQEIQSATPGIVDWLHRVFTVMGGFMMGVGALLIVVVMNASQMQKSVILTVLALAGVFTVGTMSLTNFQLSSDFRWPLLLPSFLWLIGLVLCRRYS
ncbi:MAG: hypothetical protein ABI821_02595 [Pseudomonadota bacterium]